MNKNLKDALRLIQKGDKDGNFFQGLCLLLEVAEASPQELDPVALALVQNVVKPLVKKTEEKLGNDSF